MKIGKIAVLTIADFATIGSTTFETNSANAEPSSFINHRQTLSFVGIWQIAQGNMTNNIPTVFARKVPVPGLVDMAEPPFIDPRPKVAARKAIREKDPRRDAFWYRKTFNFASPIPPVAILKVDKAKYGRQVYLNGRFLGDPHQRSLHELVGPVTLRVKRGHHVLVEKKQAASIAALGMMNVVFNRTWPKRIASCVLETELCGAEGKPVHCVRDLNIK